MVNVFRNSVSQSVTERTNERTNAAAHTHTPRSPPSLTHSLTLTVTHSLTVCVVSHSLTLTHSTQWAWAPRQCSLARSPLTHSLTHSLTVPPSVLMMNEFDGERSAVSGRGCGRRHASLAPRSQPPQQKCTQPSAFLCVVVVVVLVGGGWVACFFVRRSLVRPSVRPWVRWLLLSLLVGWLCFGAFVVGRWTHPLAGCLFVCVVKNERRRTTTSCCNNNYYN